MRKSRLPCGREKCIGKACGNFGDKGCKGDHGVFAWSRWYNEVLPTIKKVENVNA